MEHLEISSGDLISWGEMSQAMVKNVAFLAALAKKTARYGSVRRPD
jgi:hypothetical protein